jgi:hypothetical protein
MDNRSSTTLTETRVAPESLPSPTQVNPDDVTSPAPTLKGAAIEALFVLGSATLIFESVRNSLTWHLARFWGGAGDVWQTLWEQFLVSQILIP